MDGPKGPSEGGAAEEAGDGVQAVASGEKNELPTAQDAAAASASGSDAIFGAGSSRAIPAYDKPPPWAKARVSFHDPTIPRPQDVYLIKVDNSNSPFRHVWLEHSEDDNRPIHPLEKLSVEQFIDRNVPEIEPVKPADVEVTPFTLVEDQKGLTELVNKLKDVNEFAVDLEHNQYRSFQGLTCLMQISTRTEDFIIDTLKLRIYMGPYLREHFKDPSKRKVMHGADRDIMWLQRDFQLYVCNLFDTGQASRVLHMERNTLEHLLHHFCGVTADKIYQNADWRLRPLSDEMIKYAREDTHYLLYIYDLMRLRLQMESQNDLLFEVHKRSNDICLQLYEKELLTDKSYLNIYGLPEHELEANQLAVVSALHQWRDCIGRDKDESTGYVLPNKALIEIAKKMPTTTADLRRIVKSKYPFVEDNFEQILNIVRNATANSNSVEAIDEQLKKARPDQERHTLVQELKSHMPFGALEGNSTSGMQTNYNGGYPNEKAQGDAYSYPQYREYRNLTEWSSHHGPEGIQPSGYDPSGCYYGRPSAVNQSRTGTGQLAADAANGGGYQDPRKQQSFPCFGSGS